MKIRWHFFYIINGYDMVDGVLSVRICQRLNLITEPCDILCIFA